MWESEPFESVCEQFVRCVRLESVCALSETVKMASYSNFAAVSLFVLSFITKSVVTSEITPTDFEAAFQGKYIYIESLSIIAVYSWRMDYKQCLWSLI